MEELWLQLVDMWPRIAASLHLAIALVASGHAVLTKEEPRAAVSWVGLVWLSPFLGAFLYYVFGINRIRRKAVAIRGDDHSEQIQPPPQSHSDDDALKNLSPLVLLGNRVDGKPLVSGNAVEPLVNGDQAYPAMLAAIAGAKKSIMLSTYIFDNDEAGQQFAAELGHAVRRGVEVRVLIDATGSRYSFPSIVRRLKECGVQTALFLPNFRISKIAFFNLRSHRKILVVDGRIGFTGGMNIRAGNYVLRDHPSPVQDLHFRVRGPVVAQLAQAFIEDWAFTTREVLIDPQWLPQLATAGSVLARGVKDGPDRDFEKVLWTILGAISAARSRIRIVTPYFLPDTATIRFLNVAVMSGVSVDIILPARNNICFVHWAAMAMLPRLIERGCRVYLSEPPFDHSKLMLVDDSWAFIGSANWDTRSFRLNFEFNIECYSRNLVQQLDEIFNSKLARSRPLTIEELRSRSLGSRLRDGIMQLWTPYL